jgi:hypothetical protein
MVVSIRSRRAKIAANAEAGIGARDDLETSIHGRFSSLETRSFKVVS